MGEAAIDPFPHVDDPELDGEEEILLEDIDTYRMDMLVFDLPKTDWARCLLEKYAYFKGQQHDHCFSDWDGTPREPGTPYMGERWFPGGHAQQNGYMPAGFVSTDAVPYGMRKPDCAYPLAKQVVKRFTEMLYSEKRRPRLRVRSDADTERFLNAIFGQSETWDAFMEMRDIAGGCGCGALSIAVQRGEPIARAHKPWELLPLKWADSARRQPEWIIEQRLVEKIGIDKGKVVSSLWWQTREWTPTHVRVYEDVPENHPRDVPIPLRPDGEVEHGCDGVPMVWLQNTRDTSQPIGEPDCEGAWHLFDKIDRVQSQTTKATIANADPTLKVKKASHPRRRNEINLGSGNAIALRPDEDASYLEMQGTATRMGWEGIEHLRDEALQTVGCVLVDPTTAGKGQSGEALEKLWRSMEARVDRLRTPNGRAMKELAMKWLSLGRFWGVARRDVPLKSEADAEGPKNEGGILLDPWVETEDDPTTVDATEAKIHPHKIGKGNHVETIWPPHHSPTSEQINSMANGLSIASGGKPLISQETASAHMAAGLGQEDPGSEFRRLQKQQKEDEAKMGPIFPTDDGEGEDDDGPPPDKDGKVDAQADVAPEAKAEAKKV